MPPARVLVNWVIRVALWLAEPRSFWLCVALPGAALTAFLAAARCPDDALRYAGLLLQLAGVATVLLALRERGVLFRSPGIRESIAGWLRRFPKLMPRVISVPLGTAHERDTAGALDLVAWHARDPGAPVHEQLDALHKNIDIVREELSRVTATTDRRIAVLNSDMAAERATRAAEHNNLASTLHEAAVGSLSLERVGGVWLLLGITIATVPAELVGQCAR